MVNSSPQGSGQTLVTELFLIAGDEALVDGVASTELNKSLPKFKAQTV